MLLLLPAALAADVDFACDGFNKAVADGTDPTLLLQTAAWNATVAGAPPATMARWADPTVLLAEAKAADATRCGPLAAHLELAAEAAPGGSTELADRPEGVEGCAALSVCCADMPAEQVEAKQGCDAVVAHTAPFGRGDEFCTSKLESYQRFCWSH